MATTTEKTKKNNPFTGSANAVTVLNPDQQVLKDRMNANSVAWHSADEDTRRELHRENESLASLLGGTVNYDANTGYWSGTAALEGGSTNNGTAGGSSGNLTGKTAAEDYSDYLQQMYSAQKASALAELEAAYQNNLAAIDRAGQGVDAAYQAARNQTAGAGELAERNFNEYAAAAGLNNGAGGQAQLARSVALQNELNSIDTAQANLVADLQLQRANAETEYNHAVAQAQAQGDYELAAALYQEKVRVQNTLLELEAQQRQHALQEYQLKYQAQRDNIGDNQWQANFDLTQQKYSDSQAQSQKEAMASYGEAYLALGIMPSAEMLAAMGMTEADAQKYIAAIKAEQK